MGHESWMLVRPWSDLNGSWILLTWQACLGFVASVQHRAPVHGLVAELS